MGMCPRCKNCQHWDHTDQTPNVHRCQLPGLGAGFSDFSGANRGTMYTRSDFGCVHFEKREEPKDNIEALVRDIRDMSQSAFCSCERNAWADRLEKLTKQPEAQSASEWHPSTPGRSKGEGL